MEELIKQAEKLFYDHDMTSSMLKKSLEIAYLKGKTDQAGRDIELINEKEKDEN